MPSEFQPTNDEQLRDALRTAGEERRRVSLGGNGSKRLLGGGEAEPVETRIRTTGMRRILRYEPRDLTVSVEAGLPFATLQAELASRGQMIPLDGPFADHATVGGMIAANINGPRRRWFGTARDLVIGMRFITVEGMVVDTGGMVVKNVAGLDMGKLLIGSYGTLAAIARVNFKLVPKPEVERTFLFRFDTVQAAGVAATRILEGQLSPFSVELLNPVLAAQMNLKGYILALGFGGNDRVIERIVREMKTMEGEPPLVLSGDEERKFWRSMQLVTPRFLDKFAEAAIVRVSVPLASVSEALGLVDAAGSAHAGSGVVRGWFTRTDAAVRFLNACLKRGWNGLVEGSGEAVRPALTLWPNPGDDFAIMKKIKQMFDPQGLLNRGRLFHRI